ncbi:hypothetical protein EV361DRAFT_955360 [Lentinula raphanica]|nr:hypothetical protein EV361DRAFT_955360 [Lentinula raphanica]
MSRGLRSGKEFRAYALSPGQPIVASQFDLRDALEAYEDPETPTSRDYEVDLEGELSELSDLESEDSCESFDDSIEVELALPSTFQPLVSGEESSPSETEDDPSNDPGQGQGKRARRRRKTLRNRKKRRLAREDAQAQFQTGLKEIARRRVAESQTLSSVDDFHTEDLPVNSGGWSGIRQEFERIHPSFQELLGEGFELRLVEWQGQESCAVLDKSGRIISLLAGKPRDPKWDSVINELEEQVRSARKKMTFSQKQRSNKRVSGPSVSMGTSFGGGSQAPGTMAFYGVENRRILMNIAASTSFQRLIGFTNCLFQSFAEKIFTLYQETLESLFTSDPKLKRWFKNSAFSSVSFNLGPAVVSWPHTDNYNLAFGWCAITALGNFDPDRGGHLILWDLGLIIRFPPGSTILIPSALLTHSNLPIQKGEERYSIVQYSSSGLFRWVYNGFMSDKDFLATRKREDVEKREKDRKARWGNGLKMFSVWNDLRSKYSTK